jgi:hypothetical protein
MVNTSKTESGARAAAGSLKAEQVLINLSPAPAQAKVIREGYQVPGVALDINKSNFFIENLQQISRKDEPRVVTQSVPAGTKVMPGTAIDLVLAPTQTIPFDIFQNPHKDLVGRKLNTVTDTILENGSVRQMLLKYDTPGDVPAADKTALINSFAEANVQVDEASADTGFNAAFNSLRSALAFR